MNKKLNVETEYRFEVEMFRDLTWTDDAICDLMRRFIVQDSL